MASALVLSTERLPIRPPEAWQDDAWDFYDSIGELRYAVTYIANALSRVKLVAATPGTPSNPTPTPIVDEPDHPAVRAVARLAGGSVGQAGMLGAFGVLLTVPGIAYLVGELNPDTGIETWNVYSHDVLRQEGGSGSPYRLQDGDSSWRELDPESLVVQVWRPSRRFPWMPDSPVHGVLPTLRELQLLNARIIADATSRLAGAGILFMPSEAEFPPVTRADGTVIAGSEAFTEAVMEMIIRPIGDRESAAAVVPFIVRLPGELCDKPRHLTFVTAFDERLLEHRDAAIRRLAVGLDLPVETTLGLGDSNHWSAWQISDEAIDLHIDPLMETICEGLTTGYLAPTLMAQPVEGEKPIEPNSAVIWYDDSDLRTPPDQSGKAVEMYDRGEFKGDSMRRESGFTEGDKPSVAEIRQQIVLHTLLTRPDLMPTVEPWLDRIGDTGLLPGVSPPATGAPPPAPEGPIGAPGPAEAPSIGPPAPGGPTVPAASARLPDALLAACDGLIVRALERAGTKLRQKAHLNGADPGCPPEDAHTCVPSTVVASANLDELLAHAWDRVPAVCLRYGQDPTDLGRWLNSYARMLIASGQPYTFDGLSQAWGYSTVEADGSSPARR